MTTPPPGPTALSDRLADVSRTLVELREAVMVTRAQIAAVRRARLLGRAAVTLALLTFGLATVRSGVDRCESANDARRATREAFEAYTDALAAAGAASPRAPDERPAYDARLAAFRADVASRLAALDPENCSPAALYLGRGR